MTTTVDLCTALEPAAIASAHVNAAMSAPRTTVQLACHEHSAITQGLLIWADTLTEVTAEVWRVPRGDSVHFSVTELLPGGASVLVYGGQWGTPRGLGGDLPPDATTTIPLPMPRHAATVEEARA